MLKKQREEEEEENTKGFQYSSAKRYMTAAKNGVPMRLKNIPMKTTYSERKKVLTRNKYYQHNSVIARQPSPMISFLSLNAAKIA